MVRRFVGMTAVNRVELTNVVTSVVGAPLHKLHHVTAEVPLQSVFGPGGGLLLAFGFRRLLFLQESSERLSEKARL